MYKRIFLTLTGRQRSADARKTVTKHSEEMEEAVTKLCVTARYSERNGSHYFFYEENMDGSEAVIQNTLKLKDGVLELVKRGAVSTRMVFETGRTYLTDYATPYGCLKMSLHTESLETSFLEGIPKELKVIYSLSSDGQPFAKCVLTISASQS